MSVIYDTAIKDEYLVIALCSMSYQCLDRWVIAVIVLFWFRWSPARPQLDIVPSMNERRRLGTANVIEIASGGCPISQVRNNLWFQLIQACRISGGKNRN